MRAPAQAEITAGEVLLSIEDVSLSFGGVKALTDVTFDIRKSEIRAIIGPNGAGKTSMLNVINGFYQPQHGRITFKGETRAKMRPYDAAHGGIARTFQNVALFKGMTALDNIMAGRTLKMHRNFVWQLLRAGPAATEEIEHRLKVEEIIDFSKSRTSAASRSAGSRTDCRSASSSAAHSPWSPSSFFSTSRWPA